MKFHLLLLGTYIVEEELGTLELAVIIVGPVDGFGEIELADGLPLAQRVEYLVDLCEFRSVLLWLLLLLCVLIGRSQPLVVHVLPDGRLRWRRRRHIAAMMRSVEHVLELAQTAA